MGAHKSGTTIQKQNARVGATLSENLAGKARKMNGMERVAKQMWKYGFQRIRVVVDEAVGYAMREALKRRITVARS
jgi:hypothetical protein